MKTAVFERPLFGDEIKVILYEMEHEDARKIVDAMYMEALRLQKIFNFFDPESELSRLNQERTLTVSKELLYLLKKALSMSEVTEGRYDVSLGKAILARKKGMAAEKPRCSYRDIKVTGNAVSLTNREAMIDLGSIAKGYITDRLGEFLRSNRAAEFLLDSRGDILVSGQYSHILGIQDPRGEKQVCSIKIKDQAVATSGDYMQYRGDFQNSHILNQEDAISVTVISKTLEEADLLATAVFVSKRPEAEKMMEMHPDSSAMVIRKNLRQEYYNDFRRNME